MRECNGKFHDLYCSAVIIWLIISRVIRWRWGGGKEMRTGFNWGRLKERDSLEEKEEGEGGRVTPIWILKKLVGTAETGLICIFN
jgi:hypothetical protein